MAGIGYGIGSVQDVSVKFTDDDSMLLGARYLAPISRAPIPCVKLPRIFSSDSVRTSDLSRYYGSNVLSNGQR